MQQDSSLAVSLIKQKMSPKAVFLQAIEKPCVFSQASTDQHTELDHAGLQGTGRWGFLHTRSLHCGFTSPIFPHPLSFERELKIFLHSQQLTNHMNAKLYLLPGWITQFWSSSMQHCGEESYSGAQRFHRLLGCPLVLFPPFDFVTCWWYPQSL